MLRAAQRWRDFIYHIKRRVRKKEIYIEVSYEDLLENPNHVLSNICAFLEIDYEPQMMILKKPTENLRDAKEKSEIIKDNKNKFLRRIPATKLKRIEEIVCVEAEKMRYKMVHAVAYRPMSSCALLCLQPHDALRSAWFHMQKKGMVKGCRYFVNFHRQGSWRSV